MRLDNLSRFYASQLDEVSALIIRRDYDHTLEILFNLHLQSDVNMTTRLLVNLGIARCPFLLDLRVFICESWHLCQEASIIEPRQDFTNVEKEVLRTAWNTEGVRGIAQDTVEHSPAG
ncbi:hypothetical protein AB5N19_01755 [Seiridium cardinale]